MKLYNQYGQRVVYTRDGEDENWQKAKERWEQNERWEQHYYQSMAENEAEKLAAGSNKSTSHDDIYFGSDVANDLSGCGSCLVWSAFLGLLAYGVYMFMMGGGI